MKRSIDQTVFKTINGASFNHTFWQIVPYINASNCKNKIDLGWLIARGLKSLHVWPLHGYRCVGRKELQYIAQVQCYYNSFNHITSKRWYCRDSKLNVDKRSEYGIHRSLNSNNNLVNLLCTYSIDCWSRI